MQNHDTNTGASAPAENTPITPEQQQEFQSKFLQLDQSTQRILLDLMEASRINDADAMRECQQRLPEHQRHIFDDAIASAEEMQQEVKA